MNTSIINKFIAIAHDIERDRGPFIFFALFEKSDSPGIDIVFSAEWTRPQPDRSVTLDAVKLLSEKMLQAFTQDELRQISVIAPLPPEHPIVDQILFEVNLTMSNNTPYIYLRNILVQDILIAQAYILAVNKHVSAGISQSLHAAA